MGTTSHWRLVRARRSPLYFPCINSGSRCPTISLMGLLIEPKAVVDATSPNRERLPRLGHDLDTFRRSPLTPTRSPPPDGKLEVTPCWRPPALPLQRRSFLRCP